MTTYLRGHLCGPTKLAKVGTELLYPFCEFKFCPLIQSGPVEMLLMDLMGMNPKLPRHGKSISNISNSQGCFWARKKDWKLEVFTIHIFWVGQGTQLLKGAPHFSWTHQVECLCVWPSSVHGCNWCFADALWPLSREPYNRKATSQEPIQVSNGGKKVSHLFPLMNASLIYPESI